MNDINVELIKKPTLADWIFCKRCAIGTLGKTVKTEPEEKWKKDMLRARHSPIRELWFGFSIVNLPYYISNHLVRHHEGFHCYVESQRNDRQSKYDRRAARQDAPVKMLIVCNAEALMNLANKRLCAMADSMTRLVVSMMCYEVKMSCPEFEEFLVPMCEYHGNVCHEFKGGCGRWN